MHNASISALHVLGRALDQWRNANVSDRVWHDSPQNSPDANVIQNEKSYSLQLAVPGFTREQLDIKIEHRKLSVTGKVTKDEAETAQKTLRREFNYQHFSRTFTLPETADSSGISAKLENGVLLVEIPLLDAAAAAKSKIEIL